MVDYKAMYYKLAGRMATAIEVLEANTEILQATTGALAAITEKMKQAQQDAEEICLDDGEE